MLRRYGVAALGVLPDAVGGEGGVDESSARFGVDSEGALLRRLAHLLKSSEVPPALIIVDCWFLLMLLWPSLSVLLLWGKENKPIKQGRATVAQRTFETTAVESSAPFDAAQVNL